MGHWGFHSWENDAAADWLGSFAEQARIEERIRGGLSLPQDCIDEIRSAASLLLCLSELLSIPGQTQSELAHLAIERLSDALESRDYTNLQIRSLVVEEIAQLRTLAIETAVGDEAKFDPIGKAIQKIAAEQFGLKQYDVIDIDGRSTTIPLQDIVGTGFLDGDGVLHLELTDGRDDGFLLRCRCVPTKNGA